MSGYEIIGWLPITASSPALPSGAHLAGVRIRLEETDEVVDVYFDFDDANLRLKQIHGEDLNTNVVRNIRLGDLREAIVEGIQQEPERLNLAAHIAKAVAEGAEGADRGLSDDELELARLVRKNVQDRAAGLVRPRRGRAAQSDDFYAWFVPMYLDFHERFGQRVVRALTDELRSWDEYSPNLSRETVATWAKRAREESWLTHPGRGRAGGRPGRKLIAYWEAQRKEDT